MNGGVVSTPCVFIGGTLDGVRQGRTMMGYLPSTLMEPVYQPIGKDNDRHYKNIISRQLYMRDVNLSVSGEQCYRLIRVEALT